jgi:toxin-antitoxin system PIN domain toxin
MLIDANILLYAYHPGAELHARARTWIEGAFSSSARVHLAWATILAFLRIATNPRVFERPLAMSEAEAAVESWFATEVVSVVEPGERYWAILRGLLRSAQVTAALVPDAALAALALEHGLTVCTTDRDFSRFPGLKVANPLAG